ncbi:MAG: hypothetical protein KAR35_11480 [Candidatus Heimdallarchaeota archaeon]|nr:hypothetical protein [Candidatus Heimdallarchaeota archaeon]MCK5049982.1 hypothetical protein [Candidatus Heimdallarchaeota archaeon]
MKPQTIKKLKIARPKEEQLVDYSLDFLKETMESVFAKLDKNEALIESY